MSGGRRENKDEVKQSEDKNESDEQEFVLYEKTNTNKAIPAAITSENTDTSTHDFREYLRAPANDDNI